MGCNLKDLSSPDDIEISELSGMKVGIDSFLLAFQFLTSIRDLGDSGDGGPLKDSKGRPVSHLMGFLERTTTFISKGIIPVFIFDGKHPELKAEVMEERRARSEDSRKKWQAALDSGDFKEAQKWGQRCIRYTPEMVEETMELLHLLGVPAFRAAAEGEAQAAVMAAKGQLDIVATQDWDALLYGAPVMVRNLASAGSRRMGRVIRAQRIELETMLEENGLSREQLVDLAIMIGTDFHPGIRGIGPKTGLKLIKEHGDIESICQVKEKEIPKNLPAIRQIFLDHPVAKHPPLELQPIDVGALTTWLKERDFSDGRIERNLQRIEKVANLKTPGQSSLFDF